MNDYVLINKEQFFIFVDNLQKEGLVELVKSNAPTKLIKKIISIKKEKGKINEINFYQIIEVANKNGNYDLINFLFKVGKEVNFNKSELMKIAIKEGLFECVEKLIKEEKKLPKSNEYFLSIAVETENVEMVKLLLENGFKPQSNYFISIENACKIGNVEILRLLFKNYDWKQKDFPMKNFLNEAIIRDKPEVINFFIEELGVDIKNFEGELIHNCILSKNPKMMEYLLSLGLQIDFSNKWIVGEIRKACSRGYLDILKVVCKSKEEKFLIYPHSLVEDVHDDVREYLNSLE